MRRSEHWLSITLQRIHATPSPLRTVRNRTCTKVLPYCREHHAGRPWQAMAGRPPLSLRKWLAGDWAATRGRSRGGLTRSEAKRSEAKRNLKRRRHSLQLLHLRCKLHLSLRRAAAAAANARPDSSHGLCSWAVRV